MLDEQSCWDAVARRDGASDGRFFFAVTTTGVFCRPSCPARRPLRRNVRFFASPADAEGAGFRPCRRCRPLAPAAADERARRMADLCEHIRRHADSGDPLTLDELAQVAGLSPSHLQRTFRAVVGVTPRQYVEACRVEALKRQLRDGESVTDAIYGAGFGSSSTVYEGADARLGMTPGEYRAGGRGRSIAHATVETPLGWMLVAATDRGLCAVRFGDDPAALADDLRAEFPAAELRAEEPSGASRLATWTRALLAHLQGDRSRLDLPTDVHASAFRLQVWSALRDIPAGETRTYAQVAESIGHPTATRAVAGACAANPTAVVVPCHRVVRADGDLGGYRWGRERKRRLLEGEGAAAGDPRHFRPASRTRAG